MGSPAFFYGHLQPGRHAGPAVFIFEKALTPMTSPFLERLLSRFAKPPPGWAQPGKGRIVDAGWLLHTDKARFIWFEPKRIARGDPPPRHAKSASYCPSVLEHEAKLYEVACPIDLNIGFKRDESGKPVLVNLDGDKGAVRSKHLNALLTLVSEREWRHPDKPIVQFITPYIFLADEPVYMSQLPPFHHYNKDPWPGTLLAGRLPIHIWLRPMMWAFEWHDTARPLRLRRGEPWFYVRFETHDPTRPVRLVEAENTPAVQEYVQGASAVANYVSNTYSLFKTAQARRPERLLEPKARGGTKAEKCPVD